MELVAEHFLFRIEGISETYDCVGTYTTQKKVLGLNKPIKLNAIVTIKNKSNLYFKSDK